MRCNYYSAWKDIRDLPKDSKILDVGCGNGAFIQYLQNQGFTNVTGCDIIPPVGFRYGNASDTLPYEDKEFDIVTFVNVIEHVENPLQSLRECKRVLKDDGTIILVTPNVTNVWSRMLYFLTGKPLYHSQKDFEGVGHINVLPHWMLDRYFDKEGINIEDIHPTKSVMPIFHFTIWNKIWLSEAIVYKLKKILPKRVG